MRFKLYLLDIILKLKVLKSVIDELNNRNTNAVVAFNQG